MDSHSSVQNQLSSRDAEKSLTLLITLKKTQDPCLRTVLRNQRKLAKSWIGIMRDLLRTDPTHMERRVKEGTSSVLVQSGLQENWWAEAMECHCYLRNVQDPLADVQRPCERRFHSPFEGPNIRFGAEVKCLSNIVKRPRSRASVGHQSPFLEYFIGYALRSWTGDLLILDTEDLQPIPPSEMHVKRFTTETMNVYSRAGRVKSCQRNIRYLPLCARR